MTENMNVYKEDIETLRSLSKEKIDSIIDYLKNLNDLNSEN